MEGRKMKIVKGKQRHAVRAVLYGVEGIGKTTLAAQFPKPLFIDTEEGTVQMDVDRVPAHDWQTLNGALIDLAGDPQGYETVVIDTADWAERILLEHMIKVANQGNSGKSKTSIEDFGFGKGYTMIAERFSEFLGKCDKLIARGVNVLLLAHATVKRVNPPDMDEGYDRYELKLTKQSGPLLKEWADCLLFANYQTIMVEGEDGRRRGRGGQNRKLFTQRCAAWDAKNRYGLPPSIDMTIEALAPIFGQPAPAPAAKPTAKVEAAEPVSSVIRKAIAETTAEGLLTRMKARVEQLAEAGELTSDEVDEFLGAIDSKLPVAAGQTEE
jgi:hypothetical protein